jgi:hypothetical protein
VIQRLRPLQRRLAREALRIRRLSNCPLILGRWAVVTCHASRPILRGHSTALVTSMNIGYPPALRHVPSVFELASEPATAS